MQDVDSDTDIPEHNRIRMSRQALGREDIDFLRRKGLPFAELGGIRFKSSTLFGAKGAGVEIGLLEQRLGFRYPRAYVEAVVEHGDTAAGHFPAGCWWKVLDTAVDMVFWSFSLSLSGEPSAQHPRENTLLIEERFRAANVPGVPFGGGFRIDLQAMMAVDGWLYFDRGDGSLHFADYDFAGSRAIAADFPAMMAQADYVCFS